MSVPVDYSIKAELLLRMRPHRHLWTAILILATFFGTLIAGIAFMITAYSLIDGDVTTAAYAGIVTLVVGGIMSWIFAKCADRV